MYVHPQLFDRYETLILSAQKEGLDVTMSQELLNEAKYALKLKKYETAVDYVKSHYGLEGKGCGLCQTDVPCESKIPSEKDVNDD